MPWTTNGCLQAKVVSFEMLASANVQSEARAQQFASLVDAQHELLSNLQQQALPITASALGDGPATGCGVARWPARSGGARRDQEGTGRYSAPTWRVRPSPNPSLNPKISTRCAPPSLRWAGPGADSRSDRQGHRSRPERDGTRRAGEVVGRRGACRHGGLPEGRCRAGNRYSPAAPPGPAVLAPSAAP